MAELKVTETDLRNLVQSQANEVTNGQLTIVALNRVVRELEAEILELKPVEAAAEPAKKAK